MSTQRRPDRQHRPFVAVTDADDPDHAACDELLDSDPGPLVTTGLVIAEAGFLIDRQVGPHAEAALVADVVDGRIVVETLTATDWQRTLELVRTYADMTVGVGPGLEFDEAVACRQDEGDRSIVALR